ncbi:MAG: hypothetical protein Q7J48_09810 [Nocardioides sp.]|nr:hypothetical protein [Nocardioides sp.]
MTTLPRDITDLYMSPVALEFDRRLEQLAGLTEAELEFEVTLATDRQPRDVEARPALVLDMLTRALETHGWKASWVPRGLRVSHAEHHLVLGVPPNVQAYLGNG